MAKVRITTPQQLPWQVSGERVQSPEASQRMADGGPASAYRIREPGSDNAPQLVELRYHRHEVIELHCHDQDEILYILEGAMQVGGRTLESGASLSIAGGVFYTFEAGPEGLHLLNFRPRIDTSFHLPDAGARRDAAVTAP